MFSVVAKNGEILENFETYESAMHSIDRYEEDEPEIIARVSEWAYEVVSHGVTLGAFANDGKAMFAAEYRFRKGDESVRVYEVLGDIRNLLWADGRLLPEYSTPITDSEYEPDRACSYSEVC